MSHVFISYSKKNRDYAHRLANHLLEHGFDVWIDDRIDYGENWLQVMVGAVRECAAFVVIMTPEAEASRWVELEVAWAHRWEKPKFPILRSGENWPVFELTQYADCRDGKLPDDRFILELSKRAPSKQIKGRDISQRAKMKASSHISEGSGLDQLFEDETESPGTDKLKPGERPGSILSRLIARRDEPPEWLTESILRAFPRPYEGYDPDRLADKARPAPPISPDAQRLLDVMLNPQKSPPERAEAGRKLAEIGDPRPGVGLREDGLPDIDWVEIPEGEFIYQDGERVHLPTFWMARYPVTYVQFQAFIDADDGFQRDEWWEGLSPQYLKQAIAEQAFKYDNHPRDSVSWYQAVAFCRWFSEQSGYSVRLPTQQEWEKAARGTDGREYPWGAEYISGYANVDETTFGGLYSLEQSSPVGMYPQGASPYGVLDMAGNVWEWCLDELHTRLDAGNRVIRGGSWQLPVRTVRCVVEGRSDPGDRLNHIGFRVCAVARPTQQLWSRMLCAPAL